MNRFLKQPGRKRPRLFPRKSLFLLGAGVLLALWMPFALPQAMGGAIRCHGVLGNSGADGAALVRSEGARIQTEGDRSGLGYDRLGALWAFGGTRNLLRLSLDGRMLASYPLKVRQGNRSALVLVDDTVVLLVGNALYRLPITAASGTEPELIDRKLRGISLNAREGKIGAVLENGEVGLLEIGPDTFETFGTLSEDGKGDRVALLWDGRVLVDGRTVFERGAQPRESGTNVRYRHQIVGDFIYEFSWHMTVARRDRELAPAPGVIYGGSSGYFIGSLPEDGEVGLPTGIAHLGGNRYAVAGSLGVIHLVSLNAERQALETERRLGAVHQPAPMVLDRRGRTWYYSGFWDWDDAPDQALRSPTSFGSRDTAAMQGTLLPNGKMIFAYLLRGKPNLMHRAFDESGKHTSTAVDDLPLKPTGIVCFTEGKEVRALVVDAAAKGTIVSFGSNGKVRKSEGPGLLELTSPSPAVTSLAALPGGRFLAADGGSVVLLEREGNVFREADRWGSWGKGGGEHFGAEIYLDAEGDHLWVSDTDNNRVIHFALRDGRPGDATVYTGEGLETPLGKPQRIDAAGDRAVVMDWGNRRIVKLERVP